jgi:ParB family chromosome partitioning protein
LEPDPENPRELPFGVVEVRRYLEVGTEPEQGREQWESMLDLAENIKKSGVIQLIVVYRHLENYRIIVGERRFLASIIAGIRAIPARVYPDRPKNLRLLQLAENAQREDLNLWQRVKNMREVVKEWQQLYPAQDIKGVTVGPIFGVTERMARSYITLINAPEDVLDEIRHGRITSVKVAVSLARIDDIQKRQKAMLVMLNGELEATLEPELAKAKRHRTTKGMGRPKNKINLGSIEDVEIIRAIFDRLGILSGEAVDWNDKALLQKTWDAFLGELTKGSK